MGLSLAGILHIPLLERTWRPLDAGASAGLTTMTGGMTMSAQGQEVEMVLDAKTTTTITVTDKNPVTD